MTSSKIRPSVLIIGAGLLGLAAANELNRRGYRVKVIDPGPLPQPHAASTDFSKVVRIEYGADEFYSRLMGDALKGWRAWNRQWAQPVYFETGVLMLSQGPMKPGGFEFESYQTLTNLGYRPERISESLLESRFPAWNRELYTDGFFHAIGGYAHSGRVVELLGQRGEEEGVEVFQGVKASRFLEGKGSSIVGVVCEDGAEIRADETILAAGAWSPRWIPELVASFRTVAQPIFYVKPRNYDAFRSTCFPVFTADIQRTGWYGVPDDVRAIIKFANHGPGRPAEAEGGREVIEQERDRFRGFMKQAFPTLLNAPIDGQKICIYCDTWDGNFLIARHPDRRGLTVATGGSGHAFKFAPLMGGWIADAVAGISNPALERFGWRNPEGERRTSEAARFQG